MEGYGDSAFGVEFPETGSELTRECNDGAMESPACRSMAGSPWESEAASWDAKGEAM